MNRNCSKWFLGHLHVNDNSAQPSQNYQNYDKVYKIHPLLEILSKAHKDRYKPSRVQLIDKSMIQFKGRSTFCQYMPQKHIQREMLYSLISQTHNVTYYTTYLNIQQKELYFNISERNHIYKTKRTAHLLNNTYADLLQPNI